VLTSVLQQTTETIIVYVMHQFSGTEHVE